MTWRGVCSHHGRRVLCKKACLYWGPWPVSVGGCSRSSTPPVPACQCLRTVDVSKKASLARPIGECALFMGASTFHCFLSVGAKDGLPRTWGSPRNKLSSILSQLRKQDIMWFKLMTITLPHNGVKMHHFNNKSILTSFHGAS